MTGAVYFTTVLEDYAEAKITGRHRPPAWFGVAFHEWDGTVDGVCARYWWHVIIDGQEYSGTDLRGPATGQDPGALAMFATLCSFLGAGAEAYDYAQHHEPSDNIDLFPLAVNAWASQEDTTIWELGELADQGRVEALECGCVPHETKMTGMGFTCVTENQGYCNFECPHEEEEPEEEPRCSHCGHLLVGEDCPAYGYGPEHEEVIGLFDPPRWQDPVYLIGGDTWLTAFTFTVEDFAERNPHMIVFVKEA